MDVESTIVDCLDYVQTLPPSGEKMQSLIRLQESLYWVQLAKSVKKKSDEVATFRHTKVDQSEEAVT